MEVVESLGVERVIFLPDEYLGRYVASQTEVEIILWKGHCEVHERFTGQELRDYRAAHSARGGVRSSPTPSARRRCWPRPTSWARRRR